MNSFSGNLKISGYGYDGNNSCCGQKNISICGGVILGFFPVTYIDFQVINGVFHNDSDFVKMMLFFLITLDAWKHTAIKIFISISSSTFKAGE